MRWTSRDALLRLAVLSAAAAFYYTPLSFLQSDGASNATEDAQRVVEIRLWLALLVTVVAVMGVISTPLLIVSCVHAALHVAQAVLVIPLRRATSTERWCWRGNELATCAYDYGSVVTYMLILRYVLLPPPSTLSTMRRHSHQLKRFFEQHDRKYVSLVDRLLDDYTGNERLLFARIRKIYRAKSASTPLKTTP